MTAVEPLHSPRGPMGVDAIYLLTPTTQNVDRIIADFSQGRRTYKSAHLYFIDGMCCPLSWSRPHATWMNWGSPPFALTFADDVGIDDRLASRLTENLPPDVLMAFVELYCNFWALEERVFTLHSPWSFFTMFGNPGGAASADLAIEAFEDDIKVTSRSVRSAPVSVSPYRPRRLSIVLASPLQAVDADRTKPSTKYRY